jgi:hypothetical protein
MRSLAATAALFAMNCLAASARSEEPLMAGFAAVDITPSLNDGQRVFLAGYGMNRRAKGVHDPLFARTVVFHHGSQRVAITSVDLVGLQYPAVKAIRAQLPDFSYVLVASTHNHHGPDVIGIWGKGPFHRGADDNYIDWVVSRVVASVRGADQAVSPVSAEFGTAEDDSLLEDNRFPISKDGVLRVVRLRRADGLAAGLLVQWNCHPESLGPRNTQLTADFPYATIAALEKSQKCPVVYLSGAIGGLMTHPPILLDDSGQEHHEGTFNFAEHYGRAVAGLAEKAITAAEPINLTPLTVRASPISVPVHNSLYRAARALGVMRREAFVWTGDFQSLGSPMTENAAGQASAIETEVGCLRLGELYVACIPGEIYPELVYGRFEDPPAEGVDFPDAPLEPTIAQLMPSKKWLLVGLANDELGYILPKRQWDKSAPYAYGKDGGQYGEINSCSPEVAPIVMQSLKLRIDEATQVPLR